MRTIFFCLIMLAACGCTKHWEYSVKTISTDGSHFDIESRMDIADDWELVSAVPDTEKPGYVILFYRHQK